MFLTVHVGWFLVAVVVICAIFAGAFVDKNGYGYPYPVKDFFLLLIVSSIFTMLVAGLAMLFVASNVKPPPKAPGPTTPPVLVYELRTGPNGLELRGPVAEKAEEKKP